MIRWLLTAVLLMGVAAAQTPPPNDAAPFISVHAPILILNHVRVIDGTGAAPKENQTILITDGKIQAMGAFGTLGLPAGEQLDRTGYTVIPGLVGMHNHLFYAGSVSLQRSPKGDIEEPGLIAVELAFTGPRLYLAAGVTTMRTTGNVESYTDIKIKQRIDAGLMPGPKIDVTAPYLEGKPTAFAQMHELSGAEDAKHMVDYWADAGATSYKAYMNITRDELAAAIQEAHARHFKLTGHLCSVTWREAIALGIDDFEHGPVVTDTEFVADKKPDVCPPAASKSWANIDIKGPQVQSLIQDLISHHVAVTSTLPVFEAFLPGRPKMQERVLAAMSPEASQSYLTERAMIPMDSPFVGLYKKELEFEFAFAKAGGLLLGGPDPTGNGGVLPGFGDQREIELLVEAGFTPVEAIQIYSMNGATYLGQQDHIGSIAVGKQADLVLIKGDPSKKIEDIENVETVFKDGVGYDSQKLIQSVKGQVGIR